MDDWDATAAEADSLVAAVRAGLRTVADPARAPGQQAYMKSAMPFMGVRVPDARRVALQVGRGADPDTLLAAAGSMWDEADFREERYAAMALLADPRLRGDQRLVEPIEHMVRTGQWWDFTDELAHRMADLHDARPAETAELVRAWCRDEDLWMRRIAVLSQLGRRDRVDAGVLADVIDANADDPEFFMRKAIGWALREYARVRPEWVREFVAERALSPLTVREATKHL